MDLPTLKIWIGSHCLKKKNKPLIKISIFIVACKQAPGEPERILQSRDLPLSLPVEFFTVLARSLFAGYLHSTYSMVASSCFCALQKSISPKWTTFSSFFSYKTRRVSSWKIFFACKTLKDNFLPGFSSDCLHSWTKIFTNSTLFSFPTISSGLSLSKHIVDYGIYRPKKILTKEISAGVRFWREVVFMYFFVEGFTATSPCKPVSNFLKIFRCCDRTEITEPAIRSEMKPALNYEKNLSPRI